MHGFFNATNHPQKEQAKSQLDAVTKEIGHERVRNGMPSDDE